MKKAKMKVLERESFERLATDFIGFLEFMKPAFNDGETTEDNVKKANMFFRKGIEDLQDFLRNLSLVPKINGDSLNNEESDKK